MQVIYEPWLVLLSIVMAVQGAYVGFTLAVQLGDAVGVRRRVLLAGAAFSLAVAISACWPPEFRFRSTILSFRHCSRFCAGGRWCRIRDQQRPLFRATPFSVRVPDGCWHLHHALHRHGRTACERAYGARAVFYHGEPDHCHCCIRIGALARNW